MRLTTLTLVAVGLPLSLPILVLAWAGAGFPFPDAFVPVALLPLSLLPLAALVVHLSHRASHPRGAPPLRFDDYLGQSLLADLVRQTLRKHSDLVTENLPGAIDRFTLTIVDRPVRKMLPPPKGLQQLAATYLHPLLTGRAFIRAHGLPWQPAVCIVRSVWAPHVRRNPPSRADWNG